MVFVKFITYFSKIFIKEKENYINAEALVRDEEWNRLKTMIGKRLKWCVLTPTNYEYCKAVFNLKMNKGEFIEILKKRIKYLQENNEQIILSVFLGKVKTFLIDKSQKKMLKEANNFFKSMGISSREILFLDNSYNKFSIRLAKHYGYEQVVDLGIFIVKPLRKLINTIGLKTTIIHKIIVKFKEKRFRDIFYLIIGMFKEVREKTIHVEALVREDQWEQLKRKVIGKNYIWYIITPVNYEYCRVYFNLNMDFNKFEAILKKRIKFLLEQGENIQLHLHLAKDRRFLDFNMQKTRIREAVAFLNKLNIKPDRFVAGWWIYDKQTVSLLKKVGFKEISDYTINPFMKPVNYNGMKIKFVHHYWHDFDFL